MKESLLIVGAGDMARIVASYFERWSDFTIEGFATDSNYLRQANDSCFPLHDLLSVEREFPPHEVKIFVAIGYSKVNRNRARIFLSLKEKGYSFANFVHPTSMSLGLPNIGVNTFVFENNTIQDDVIIGDDVIIWSGNHIGHGSRVGDHCFISSQVVISGNCLIGAYSFLGVNSTVGDGVQIGSSCVLGPSSVVLRDTEAAVVYVELPTPRSSLTSDKLRF